MPMLDMPLEQLKEYKGTNPKPQDFDAFWAEALAELDGVPPAPVLQPAGVPAKIADCFDLTYTGVGGARIYAKYLRPKAPGPHPCILAFHGYSGNSGNWADYLAYVSQGFCVAAMDCRGQGGRSQDPGGLTGTTLRGHIIRGVQDGPKALLFRSIFLDTVQLQRTVAGFDEVDAGRLVSMGGSQGGGLSAACGALAQGVVLSLLQHPFLSDYQRVWDMDLCEAAYMELGDYFRRFDPLHRRHGEFFNTLGYIDVHHLAPRIRHRAVMAISQMDTVCPPSTQFAVYNNLGGEKAMHLYSDFGHELLPQWPDIMLEELARM